jgi:hypothetical protein
VKRIIGFLAAFGVAAPMAAGAWAVGFFTALDRSPPAPPVPDGVSAPENFAMFAEVWSIIDREFYWDRPEGARVMTSSRRRMSIGRAPRRRPK